MMAQLFCSFLSSFEVCMIPVSCALVRGVVRVEVVDRRAGAARGCAVGACQLGSGSYLAAKAGRLSAWT